MSRPALFAGWKANALRIRCSTTLCFKQALCHSLRAEIGYRMHLKCASGRHGRRPHRTAAPIDALLRCIGRRSVNDRVRDQSAVRSRATTSAHARPSGCGLKRELKRTRKRTQRRGRKKSPWACTHRDSFTAHYATGRKRRPKGAAHGSNRFSLLRLSASSARVP